MCMVEINDISSLSPMLYYLFSVALFSIFIIFIDGIQKTSWEHCGVKKVLIYSTIRSWPVLFFIVLLSGYDYVIGSDIALEIGKIVGLSYPLSFGMFLMSRDDQERMKSRIGALEFDLANLQRRLESERR